MDSFFSWINLTEHIVFTLVIVILINIYLKNGKEEFFRVLVVGLKALPGVKSLIGKVLHNEVTSFVSTTALAKKNVGKESVQRMQLPKKGISPEELRNEMNILKSAEAESAKEGKIFAYVYTVIDQHWKLQSEAFDKFEEKIGHSLEHDTIVNEFLHAFLHENALNPMVFPSLRKMETEIVSMTAAMLNGDQDVVGFVTSGGTESNLMAVKTYRDMARKSRPNIRLPEIIAPITVHPTIDKAAHYFGLKVIHTPVGDDFRADVQAMKEAINENTVMLVASAPQFCHGIIDPIKELSDLAVAKGLPLHVDGCFGGFMLPWVEKLGYNIPPFDFRLPGVSSISADVHKYGYSVKGSSVIVYRNAEIRKHQIYTYPEWPGGLYGSPSMAGTRGGGTIASAWVSLKALGVDGFMDKAKELMDTTEKMMKGVKEINGLKIMGEPHMTSFAIGPSDKELDIYAVADAMEKKGWTIERNQKPSCIHCSILPRHTAIADDFIRDLKDSTAEVKENKTLAKKGTAAMYGMIGTIPDKTIVSDFLVEFFSEVYK
ncbi:SGPL1 [Mytilus coruscus]|uniref:sphinganine-1-phosphate aldolase n=1 Tax=Mytilus coruscus TaxID=42192 RepID=A0A6J8C5T0_MYTCO|nr:SGPL1 [Mytilus coruscus]